MSHLLRSLRATSQRDPRFASFSVWTVLSVPLCLVLAGTLMSCGGTEVTEGAIPPNFTTYVAEGEVFTISYPEEWQTPNYMIEPMKATLAAFLRESGSSDVARAIDEANVLFVAGAPTDTGYNPNVNVIAVASDNSRGSLNGLVDSCLQRFAASAENLQELRRFDVTIDGHDAIVVEYTVTIPSFAISSHCMLVVMRGQKAMWFVTCTVLPPLEMAVFEDELMSVVMSLRLGDMD